MTTKVIFTFHNPDGSPQANEKFTVRLTRPGMSDAEHCVVIPETYEMVTDVKGEFTMDLESSTSAYRVTAIGDDDEYEDDPCSQYTFTFYVPDSADPVYVQELILMPPPTNLPWDEEAINKITQAVVDAREARDEAEAQADRAEVQVDLAKAEVVKAQDEVVKAKAEVTKAQAEVTKAAQQVELAKVEVGKAEASAAAAKVSETNAANAAAGSVASATAATNQANRAKTEADRAESLANQVAEKVEGGNLPALVGMNETFTYEGGEDHYNWTRTGPVSVSQHTGYIRVAKTDASSNRAFIRKSAEFPDGHWIAYFRVKTQTGTAAQNRSAQIRFIAADGKDYTVYFNINASGLVEPNTIHMQGSEGSTRNAATMFTGLSTESWLDMAVKFDAVNRHIELFRRMPDGTWQKGGGRLMVDTIKPTTIEISSMPVAPNGWWMDVDFITVCRPNLICYGDSIAAGQNEYGVTRGTEDYHNHRNWAGTWFGQSSLYATNRNNLVLVQGVEGWRTWQYLDSLGEIENSGVKVVFMHASTNDHKDATMTMAKRTSDTQAIIDRLHAVGAQVVLFNSMQGTKAFNDSLASGVTKLKAYTDQWWTEELHKVTGLGQVLDIARLVGKDGYFDPAIAADDGLHLTAASAKKIADKLGQFYSNSTSINGLAPLESPAFTGIPTVPTQTPFLPYGKQIANTEYVITFIQDWTSNYGYGDLSMRNRTGSQMEAGGVRSGYYYVPGDSSNPLPGNVYAFVHHMSYDTNKGWELWNHCYTDRVYMRYSNNAGVWQTPVEVVTEKWMERNSFMTPRVSAFNRLPVASSAGFEGVVPLQTNSSGAWRNVNAGVAGLGLLGATTAGNALHYIGGMPKAPTNDRANSNLNNLPDECGFYGLGPAPYSNIPPGVDAINPVGSTVYHQVYDANTATQIFIPRTSDICYFRRKAGGTWSPWVRYLTDLQLVGTTTDSSAGVPNGAIMQINGSAAVNVGVALRFADGTQIVRALLQLDYGAVDLLQRQFTFPMAFVGKPVVTATLEQGTVADINNMPLQALGPVMVASIYAGNCNVRVMRSQGYTAGGFAAGSKMLCSVIAMGFWK
ncbi:tail protein [Pseudomonas phage PAP02]|uniref:tail protein n=1 Tax=Pseudomonas phage PAP02 TaxID=2713224 RepID=UPI0023293480|nr:tail protein [Pseudomonas phage PAP02]QKE55099.1 tail fiber protein [Pseudomonas phage PAP02]